MNYEIFTDEKDKIEGVKALNELRQSKGWEYLERALHANITAVQEELETTSFETVQEVSFAQKRKAYLEGFRSLPAILIAEAQDTTPEPEDDDPF